MKFFHYVYEEEQPMDDEKFVAEHSINLEEVASVDWRMSGSCGNEITVVMANGSKIPVYGKENVDRLRRMMRVKNEA